MFHAVLCRNKHHSDGRIHKRKIWENISKKQQNSGHLVMNFCTILLVLISQSNSHIFSCISKLFLNYFCFKFSKRVSFFSQDVQWSTNGEHGFNLCTFLSFFNVSSISLGDHHFPLPGLQSEETHLITNCEYPFICLFCWHFLMYSLFL